MGIILCSIHALLLLEQIGYAELQTTSPLQRNITAIPVSSFAQWNEWSSWTQCSATCGHGSSVRSRQCLLNGVPANTCVGQVIDVPHSCIDRLCSAQWNEWSSWTQCSATCGYGHKIRSRQCMLNGAPNNTCVGQSIEASHNCIDRPCSAQWNEWSSWTQCSATCGYGHKIRSRQCMLNGAPNITCVGQSIEASHNCIDRPCSAQWNDWSSWSQCSVTCGYGHNIRSRQCMLNGAPNNTCVGQSIEASHSCIDRPCSATGTWQEWSSWTADCDCTAEQKRSRNCTLNDTITLATTCSGDSIGTRICLIDKGVRDQCRGALGPWIAVPGCSTTCGEGTTVQYRSCILSDNTLTARCDGGPLVQAIHCNLQKCPGRWDGWSEWSACSQTCGLGIRTRERNCTGPQGESGDFNCTGGNPMDHENCTLKKCPGIWGQWAEWTPCSGTCGLGVRTRKQSCTGLQGQNGDFDCIGESPIDSQYCTVIKCPGILSRWGEWTPCSKTCGLGIRIRERNCTGLHGENGDFNCTGGNLTDSEKCTMRQCKGIWTNWAEWTPCSMTCGLGIRTRDRNCLGFHGENGDFICFGAMRTENENCTVMKCPVGIWDAWSGWTECSQTCGNGVRLRTRNCTSHNHTTLENDCHGETVESITCAEISCPVMTTKPPVGLPVWSEWTSWSACTHTCDGGAKSRSRSCSIQNSTASGNCEGQSHEYAVCAIDPCPRPPVWSEWSSWSACTHTCNGGMKVRARDCTILNVISPGKCEGQSHDYGVCAIDPCPVITTKPPDLPAWSEWSSWTVCSYTCDGGAKVRSRDCRLPNSTVSTSCEGQSHDYTVCGTDPCSHPPTSDGNSGLWISSSHPTIEIIGRETDN